MAVDYDLVILGGTEAARSAAIAASRWKARIALVEPLPNIHATRSASQYYHSVFVEAAHQLHQASQICQQGWLQAEAGVEPTHPNTLNKDAIAHGIFATVQALQQKRSPAVLAAQGIDVVFGEAEFVRRPRLAVSVANPTDCSEPRLLRSRAYLLATGTQTTLPSTEGLATVQPLIPEDLGRSLPALTLPSSLIVLGGTAAALELAQAFSRLGTQVSLVVGNTRLLPQEDPEVGTLLQAHLEAEGITVLTHTNVTQVRSLEGKKWIQVGSRAIAAEEILVATEPMPHVKGLNLEGVGVKWHDTRILTNQKLQTTHPRIYALEDGRDHAFTQLATQTILKNVLLFPAFSLSQTAQANRLFQKVQTDPVLFRWGVTELEARRRYGDQVTVVKEAMRATSDAQIFGKTTGFVKLIIQNRQVIGQVFVGNARFVGSVFEETRQTMLSRSRQQRLQQNPVIREFQEGWFDFWRDRLR